MSNNPYKITALAQLKNDAVINSEKSQSVEKAVSTIVDLIRKIYETPGTPFESIAFLMTDVLKDITKLDLASIGKMYGKDLVVTTIESIINLINATQNLNDKESIVEELQSLIVDVQK